MLRSILVVFPSVRWGEGQGIKDSATTVATFLAPRTGEMGNATAWVTEPPFPHIILATAGCLP